MSRIVIAAYRPKPGQEKALQTLMRRHYGRLRAEGLVTDRQLMLMRAADGSVVEIFEWLSTEAMAAAAGNRSIQKMRDELAAACDSVPVGELAEAQGFAADFESIEDAELHPEFSP